jgi:hypothetical protein
MKSVTDRITFGSIQRDFSLFSHLITFRYGNSTPQSHFNHCHITHIPPILQSSEIKPRNSENLNLNVPVKFIPLFEWDQACRFKLKFGISLKKMKQKTLITNSSALSCIYTYALETAMQIKASAHHKANCHSTFSDVHLTTF